MITVLIYDHKSMTGKTVIESKTKLARQPLARMQFCNDCNKMISVFIKDVLGKDKKTMKDLDKEK